MSETVRICTLWFSVVFRSGGGNINKRNIEQMVFRGYLVSGNLDDKNLGVNEFFGFRF